MGWEEIYKNKLPGHYLKYPSDAFVPLFFRNLKHVTDRENCLDFGCGSGNNSEVLAGFFKNLYLVDISPTALSIAAERVCADKSMTSCKIEDFWPNFDFILAWQVLCFYDSKQSLKKIITTLRNKLTKGGLLLCSITTTEDSKAILSEKSKDDENVYIIGDEIPHQKGLRILAFRDSSDFLKFFQDGLEILDYGKYCRLSYLDNNNRLSEYYVVARKL